MSVCVIGYSACKWFSLFEFRGQLYNSVYGCIVFHIALLSYIHTLITVQSNVKNRASTIMALLHPVCRLTVLHLAVVPTLTQQRILEIAAWQGEGGTAHFIDWEIAMRSRIAIFGRL